MALKRWFQSALALALLGLGVALAPTPAHATGEVYGPYLLVNYDTFQSGSPQCIDDPGSSKNNNTIMTIYRCNGGANQQWRNETKYTNTDFWTFNGASNKCLTVRNASTTQGEKILQYTCNSGTNERWTYPLIDSGSTYWITMNGRTYSGHYVYQIKNLKSGLCVATNNGAVTSGTQLVQVGCGNVAATYWVQLVV